MYSPWDIEIANPVNRRHPLNRRRLLWLLALPHAGWHGGGVWHDLMGRQNGTLGGVATGSWGGNRGRPGGWGSLALRSASDYVSLPDKDLAIANGYTLGCWAWTINDANLKGLIGRDDATRFWQFRVEASGVVTFIRFDSAASVVSAFSSTASVEGGWHRIVATFTGTGSAIYIDGRLDGSDAVTTANKDGTGSQPIIGQRSLGALGNQEFDGWMDDVSIWNRGFSAEDARIDYEESRLGYPNMLNRTERPWMRGPIVASASQFFELKPPGGSRTAGAITTLRP